jgi:hypothetical protein
LEIVDYIQRMVVLLLEDSEWWNKKYTTEKCKSEHGEVCCVVHGEK